MSAVFRAGSVASSEPGVEVAPDGPVPLVVGRSVTCGSEVEVDGSGVGVDGAGAGAGAGSGNEEVVAGDAEGGESG